MRDICQTGSRFLQWPRSRVLAHCGALRGESGNALIEVALIVTFFVMPLMLGTAEMGYLVYDSAEISNAAHAAAMYGAISPTTASDSTGMTAAARADAIDFGANLTATPTAYWACSAAEAGAQYTTKPLATAGCTGTSNHAVQFVQVATSAAATPPIHFPGIAATFTLRGLSVMEVAQP